MKAVLTDIMGTTTPAGYLKMLLADMSANSADFIARADPVILPVLDRIKAESGLTDPKELATYIDQQFATLGKKIGPDYLALSGAVNVEGYKTGRLHAEFFDDVPAAFQRWRDNGRGIYVFSSGSEDSQRIMFQGAKQGDLSRFVNGFFDTAKVGRKTDADSYRRIIDAVKVEPAEMPFLSDLEDELEAAHKAGLPAMLVVRPGNKPVDSYQFIRIKSFDEIQ